MVIYFGAIVSVLYYFGIMQFVLTRLAVFVQMAMDTTATESFNAVACIFLGQVLPCLFRVMRHGPHAE